MTPNKTLILIVDDDPDFLETYKQVLESKGYAVSCCLNAEEAGEKLTKERPGLVITDLMMSSLDSGFSLSRIIKEDKRFRHIPVIIVTGVEGQRGFDFSPRTPDELKAMNADAYFTKPVAPDILISKVEELLHRNTFGAHKEDSL